MSRRRKRGRPPYPAGETMATSIRIPMKVDLHAAIRAHCERSGYHATWWVRNLIITELLRVYGDDAMRRGRMPQDRHPASKGVKR